VQSPRRRFLKVLAAAPIAGAAAAAAAQPAAQAPAPADPVADALAEVARQLFGAHLDAAELEEVRREIVRNRAAAGRLRAAARLRNADEPATRFEARPKPRQEGGR
jgi:hypothetical protein